MMNPKNLIIHFWGRLIEFYTKMQIEINFQINYRDYRVISNDMFYAIRRVVALTFENSEFGRVVEADNDRFSNMFIIPFRDEYYIPENDIVISYSLTTPLEHGNLGVLLLQSIPQLIQRLNTQYNLETRIRILYS